VGQPSTTPPFGHPSKGGEFIGIFGYKQIIEFIKRFRLIELIELRDFNKIISA